SSCQSDLYDGSTSNKVLHLPIGGTIFPPERTYKMRLNFADMGSDTFAIDVVLSNGTTIHYTDARGGSYLEPIFPVPISKILVVSTPAAGHVGIANLKTYDFHGLPDVQQQISFENFI